VLPVGRATVVVVKKRCWDKVETDVGRVSPLNQLGQLGRDSQVELVTEMSWATASMAL
jgi:hypothetical protein